MPASRHAPGPKGHVFLGSLPEFTQDMLGFSAHCAQTYGDVVSLRLVNHPVCLLNHPEHFEYVLITHHRNFIKHRLFWRHVTAMFGKGLLVNEGDPWLRQRRLMQPTFHREQISTYGQVMVRYTEQMLNDWRDGETLDIHPQMRQLTMGIVAKALFDVEMASDVEQRISHALDLAIKEIVTRIRRPFKIADWVPIPGNLRYQRTVRQLNELVYGIIKARRASKADRGDLLSRLMTVQNEDGSTMTDRQLRDEVVTFFLAGHDTTALTLVWTWYLLSQHPEVATKLLAELDSVLNGRPPTVDDVPRLSYTRMVITESMRLYPPAYSLGREAVNDCEIGGYVIPRGTTVLLSPWVMHRDERFFEQPEAFIPQRWADDLAKRLPRLAYLPFGGGPRVCIGQSFAMMEAALLLTTIAQRFNLTLSPDQQVEPLTSITLQPKSGMRMSLSAR